LTFNKIENYGGRRDVTPQMASQQLT